MIKKQDVNNGKEELRNMYFKFLKLLIDLSNDQLRCFTHNMRVLNKEQRDIIVLSLAAIKEHIKEIESMV